MVLYNRTIQCVVLVCLKRGKLDSGDIGQMNTYVGYWRKNRQSENEKDAIGLIICQDADKEDTVYSLGGLEEKIFVAKYSNSGIITSFKSKKPCLLTEIQQDAKKAGLDKMTDEEIQAEIDAYRKSLKK